MLTDHQRKLWQVIVDFASVPDGPDARSAVIKAVAAHLAALEAEHRAAQTLSSSFARWLDLDDPTDIPPRDFYAAIGTTYEAWCVAVEEVEDGPA